MKKRISLVLHYFKRLILCNFTCVLYWYVALFQFFLFFLEIRSFQYRNRISYLLSYKTKRTSMFHTS